MSIISQKYESFCFLCNLAASPEFYFMVLIHNHSVSERFKYIADLIFSQMLGVQFSITASADDFANYPGPKIVYGKEPLPDGLFIKAHGLLLKFDERHFQQ